MSPPKSVIHIIEDDPGCCYVYENILSDKYILKVSSTLLDFKKNFNESDQLIIADLDIQGTNFLNFFTNELKLSPKDFAMIMISSDDGIKVLEEAFLEGVKDYLVKPFKKNELIVKIERILSTPSQEVDFLELKAKYSLTEKEAQILIQLLDTKDGIKKELLIRKLYQNIAVHPKTFDVHLSNLRKKMALFNFKITSQNGLIKLIKE